MRKGKPNDPGRKSRILQATLEVMKEDGISAASYRRIAAKAQVPLGSVSYYFPVLEGLIISALDTTRSELKPRYETPLQKARTVEEIVDALVDATIGETSPSISDIRLYEEIRHYGARNSKMQDILRAVESDSLVMLSRVVPTATGLAINAILWGWWSYRLVHPQEPLDKEIVRLAYQAIVTLPLE